MSLQIETFETDRSDYEAGDVDMGEYRIDPKMIGTGGVSTCVVLVAHNDETKLGLVGHFYDIAANNAADCSDANVFDAALAALPSLGKPEHTEIILGGGSPFFVEGQDQVETAREIAVAKVQRYLGSAGMPEDDISILWLNEQQSMNVRLYCEPGILGVGWRNEVYEDPTAARTPLI